MQHSPLIKKLLETAGSEQIAVQETTGKSCTYKDLHSTTDRLAAGLRGYGFKTGDRVLLLVKPGIDAARCVIAVLKAGGCIVIADPGTGNELFKERIAEAKPQWTLVDPALLKIASSKILTKLLRRIDPTIPDITAITLPRPLLVTSSTRTKNTTGSLIADWSTSPLPDVAANNEALIVFTSGTTSKPKGVVHTHKTVAASLAVVRTVLLAKTPKLYTTQPYFLLLGIGVGATVIISPKAFSSKRFLRDSDRYKPDTIFGPPGEFLPLISYCKQRGIAFPGSYTQILFGSAPITQAFLQKFYAVASKSLVSSCLYGMTEAIPIAVISGATKLAWRGNGDVLGRPVTAIKTTIKKDGELFVSGAHVMPHYMGQEPLASVSTGDIVTKDANGNLVLLGRKKDMILRRSYNIYPALYESTICKIPGIKDAALIGIYNTQAEDEHVVLVAELDAGASLATKDILRHLQAGPYSIDTNALPDEVVCMPLPYSGRQKKVNKQQLRELLAK